MISHDRGADEQGRKRGEVPGNGDLTPTVTVTLRDEPPEVPPGTAVEIIVVEREGLAGVYADLLVNPPGGEAEKALAASCLLGLCHERYRCGRTQGLGQQHTELWTWVIRLLQLVQFMLDDFRSYAAWPQASIDLSSLGEQAQLLVRLLTSLQATILNLLKEGVAVRAPVWQAIDHSFADIVRRATDLQLSTARVVARHRAAVATPRFLSLGEYLASPVCSGLFSNHDDYLRAMQLAERTGLDLGNLTLGLYQELDVVAVVKGIRQ